MPKKARGVICIDTHHPLEGESFNEDEFQGVLKGLREKLNSELAWYVRVRRRA